mgnify:CR=1 FL=1
MGIVLDIILIIIVVLPIVIGLRRGMVGTLMGFISVVLALIIARVAVPYIQPVAPLMPTATMSIPPVCFVHFARPAGVTVPL